LNGDITSSNSLHPILNRSEFFSLFDASGAAILPIVAVGATLSPTQ
jgi:hypothetical protein